MLQELEAIKARVREMEEEAEKLKELQNEVEKQMNLSPPPGASSFFSPFQGRRLHFPPICPHLPSRLVLLSHYPVRGKPHNHLSYCLLCARLEIISLSKCKCYTHFQAVTPYQFRMCIKIWVHFNAWLKYIILIFNSMFLTLRDDFFFKCKQKNLCSVPVCNALMSNFIRLNLNK